MNVKDKLKLADKLLAPTRKAKNLDDPINADIFELKVKAFKKRWASAQTHYH